MEATMIYLANGEADLAFCYDEMVEDGHDFTPLFGAPPYVLIAADEPLAQNSSVYLKELAEQPMIMLDLPRTKAYFTNMFEQFGMKPNIVHSTRSAEIARALVAGGHGYSLLNICPPDYRYDDTRFRVLPLRDKLSVPTFGIVTLAGIRKPNIVQEFIEQCVDLKQDGAFDSIVVKLPSHSPTK
jgi:DNA-binding transcriptional LysR family regulator